MAPKAIPVEERMWRRVNFLTSTGCWEWMGATNWGYGVIGVPGRRNVRVHRVAYEHLVGPIPEGMVLDHLCRNRKCVNPSHLEAVTQRENVLRGTNHVAEQARRTECPQGHKYDLVDGHSRRCSICRNAWGRAHYAKSTNGK